MSLTRKLNTQTQKTAGLVEHTCKACAQEVEVRASRVQVHPQLYSEFRASLGCIRACLKIQTSKQNTIEYTHLTKRFKMPWTDRQATVCCISEERNQSPAAALAGFTVAACSQDPWFPVWRQRKGLGTGSVALV